MSEDELHTKIKKLEKEIKLLQKKLNICMQERQDIEKHLLYTRHLLVTTAKETEAGLKKAKNIAESANKVKSAFLASMSHELRTPLNAIIGYSEMLQEETMDAGHSSYSNDLKKIIASAKLLLNLINDILDLSKIEAGRLEILLEDISLNEFITELETIIKPVLEKNQNTFALDVNVDTNTMHTDVVKLRQCLLNLLSNASKFTKQGKVSLAITTFTYNESGWIQFAVSDTGIGLSPEQITKLFHPFTQAEATTTRKFGGTGLGLYLTKKFCNMLGGDVEVTSKLGEGSTFTIKLPLKSNVNRKISD